MQRAPVPVLIDRCLAVMHLRRPEHLIVRATACVLAHQATATWAQGVSRAALAAAALLLASKLEECRVDFKLDALCTASGGDREAVIDLEYELVTKQVFAQGLTCVQHPYAALAALSAERGPPSGAQQEAAIGLVNDAYLYAECLQHTPAALAGAAVTVAREILGREAGPPSGYRAVSSDAAREPGQQEAVNFMRMTLLSAGHCHGGGRKNKM